MTSTRSSWFRSKVAAGVSVAFVVGAVMAPGTSQAEPGIVAQDAVFGNGTAKATALIAKVAPGVGALELGITSGIAVSDTTNALSQAQAQAVDLGLIGTSLTAEGCDGSATLTADQLPQPLRVDNRAGDTAAAHDEVPLGDGLGGARLSVNAKATPSAGAQASGAGIEIAPLLKIGAGTSTAETEVFPGEGREARARVSVDLDIGGIVKLGGLTWEAKHHTGATRDVHGSFSLGTADVGGIPFPTEEFEPVRKAVNDLLALSGITIDFPRVQQFTTPSDVIRVTPMRIVLKDSPLGAAVLGPVLVASQEQRSQLFDQLVENICDSAAALLVGDIGISVVSGTGFLAVEIGGVEALSGEFAVGEAIAVPTPAAPIAGTPTTPGTPGFTPGTPGGTLGNLPVATPGTAAPRLTGTTPVADVGPVERICESVHPFDWPSCSTGAAGVAGIAGLLGTAAMFGLDFRRQRPRPTPTEEAVVA